MNEGSRQVILESKNLEQATQEITKGMNEITIGADQVNVVVDRVNDISVKNIRKKPGPYRDPGGNGIQVQSRIIKEGR
jgi:hypothetical protein